MGLLLPTCLEFVYRYWALGKIGAVVAPIKPLSRLTESARIPSDSEAKAVGLEPNVSGNNLLQIIQEVRENLRSLQYLIVSGDEVLEGNTPSDGLVDWDASAAGRERRARRPVGAALQFGDYRQAEGCDARAHD